MSTHIQHIGKVVLVVDTNNPRLTDVALSSTESQRGHRSHLTPMAEVKARRAELPCSVTLPCSQSNTEVMGLVLAGA